MGEPAGVRVLVVEDEANILRGLSDVLRFRGCEVATATDGLRGLQMAQAESWDLVVLDIMLPELDGFRVCQQLRDAGRNMPVLMLTAKGDEEDVVRGFGVGADDYVIKPFSVRELTARIDALLRRTARTPRERFQLAELTIEPERGVAIGDDGEIELTAREVRILRVLGRDRGHIVSRRVLLRDAWDMNNVDALETRTVDVHMAKLRKKLGRHGELIETVRGQGYRVGGG